MDSVVFDNIFKKKKIATDPYIAKLISSAALDIVQRGNFMADGLASMMYMDKFSIPYIDSDDDEEPQIIPQTVITDEEQKMIDLHAKEIKKKITPALAIRTMRVNKEKQIEDN